MDTIDRGPETEVSRWLGGWVDMATHSRTGGSWSTAPFSNELFLSSVCPVLVLLMSALLHSWLLSPSPLTHSG